MELPTFLRTFRKARKLSVRAFAEMMDVNKFRLEKWEKGIQPNYSDELNIKKFFRVKDIQNFSEDFLRSFEIEKVENNPINEILSLKDLLIAEKDKRIESLEETIFMLKEAQAEYGNKKKS